MNKTSIEWTDFSVNPFKMQMPDGTLINVCVHKSDGCRNCYAEMIVRRWWKKQWGEFPGYTPALLKLGTPVLVEEELKAVLRLSDRIASGKADPAQNKIFWNDMTDEFLEFWPITFLDKCFAIRALTPNLIHQVLTKRALRMREYMTQYISGKRKIGGALGEHDNIAARLLVAKHGFGVPDFSRQPPYQPPSHVHLGVSVEDQRNGDERIRLLLETPAAVRWCSVEPLLSAVNLNPYLNTKFMDSGCYAATEKIDGIVIGGESGAGHRQMPIDSAISLARDAHGVGVSVYFKQDSGPRPGMQGRVPDDVWAMKEWPEIKTAVPV